MIEQRRPTVKEILKYMEAEDRLFIADPQTDYEAKLIQQLFKNHPGYKFTVSEIAEIIRLPIKRISYLLHHHEFLDVSITTARTRKNKIISVALAKPHAQPPTPYKNTFFPGARAADFLRDPSRRQTPAAVKGRHRGHLRGI